MEFKYIIKYTDSYWEDIDDIASYYFIKYKNPNLILSLISEIESKADILKTFPFVNKPFESNVVKKLYYYFNAKNYVVLYHVDEDLKIIKISRVLYAGMDLQNMNI